MSYLGLSALLLLTCATLAGLGIASMLLERAYARKERLARRIAGAAGADRRSLMTIRPRPRLSTAPPSRPAAARVAAIFGIDLAGQARAETKWYVVLGFTLMLARLPAGLITGMIGPLGWLSVPVIWVLAARSFFGWREKRRRELLFGQFPDALATIVRSIRVGIPVSRAVAIVGREAPQPTGAEFAQLADALTVGVSLEEALQAMANRNQMPEYRFFATALVLQEQTGGGLTATLENLADVICKRVALRARGKALAAEARTSAAVLTGLPFVAGLGLWVIDPAYMSVMFTTHAGNMLLSAALGTLGCGTLVMRSIIQSSLE